MTANRKAVRDRYYQKNRERLIAESAAYDRRHRAAINVAKRRRRNANPARFRTEARKLYAKDLDASRAKTNARRATNPEAEKRKTDRYRAAHPHKIIAWNASRRAMRLEQRCGCCSDAEMAEVYAIAGLVSGDVDHKTPLALGGHHCMGNLQALTTEDHKLKTKRDARRIADARLRNRLLKRWGTHPYKEQRI